MQYQEEKEKRKTEFRYINKLVDLRPMLTYEQLTPVTRDKGRVKSLKKQPNFGAMVLAMILNPSQQASPIFQMKRRKREQLCFRKPNQAENPRHKINALRTKYQEDPPPPWTPGHSDYARSGGPKKQHHSYS